MRKIPGTLLERFADDLTVDERDEMAIPSYTHRNPVMRWMAWRRLEVMAGRLRRAFAASQAGPGGAVLDFGCGTGVLLEEASQCAEKVYGVDIVLGPARTLVEEWALTKVELLGPAEAADRIPEDGLDVIVAAQVLEHIDPLDETLALFRKWLKPGGRLLVSLPTENALYRFGRRLAGFHGEYHHHTAASSHREILAAGFRRECVKKIPAPGPLAIYWVLDYVPA
jgi:SAM-dependent methyltransferase